jgi:hypothetical protein
MINITYSQSLFLILLGVLAVSIFSVQSTNALELKVAQLGSESDWKAANARFIETYAEEKKHILSQLGPVLICGHGAVTLLNGESKHTVPLESSLHDHLKTSDHETLELYIILRDKVGHPLDSDTLVRLKELRHTLAETKETVSNTTLADATKQNDLNLLNRTIAFVDKVLNNGSVSESELQSFTRSSGDEALENAYFAMKAYLKELETLVDELVRPLSLTDRKRLHVIVYGLHMAQNDNAELQFFEKLLGETSEGLRVIFCDETKSDGEALDSLVTHILDASIGKSFFGDPMRMHRDFRADAAHRYLEEHPLQPIDK